MKLAIINDLHFGVRNDSPIFLDYQEKFFKEVFFPYIDKEKIKVILNLGDTFDRRKYVNFATFQRVRDFFFDEIASREIEYHMIAGNHDTYYSTTNEVNAVSLLLQEYSNFNIYAEQPVELEFGSLKIMMVPWMAKGNYDLCMESIRSSSAAVLMGHFSIEGFEMSKGRLSEHGLSKDLFSGYEAVYSGHFHHPSEYGNIRYLGAQYQMTWIDYDERRSFHILDTETKELKAIENPNQLFHKLVYDDSDMNLEDISELDFSILKDTFVKVLVKSRKDMYLYDTFMSKLNDCGAADVKSIEDTTVSINSHEVLDDVKDTKSILFDYVNNIKTDLPKEKLISMIDTLYNEAMSI